jgi:hypothetical protein
MWRARPPHKMFMVSHSEKKVNYGVQGIEDLVADLNNRKEE